MGGVGFASNGMGNLNDLWNYDPVTNVWTWMNGDNIYNTSVFMAFRVNKMLVTSQAGDMDQ